jgi:hypothetical protein
MYMHTLVFNLTNTILILFLQTTGKRDLVTTDQVSNSFNITIRSLYTL